jgi:hypothetical protein
MHFGVAYRLNAGSVRVNSAALSTVGVLVQAELQDVQNSDYQNATSAGAELSLLEILHLRAGAYRFERDDFGFPEENESELNEMTYGLGLTVPIDALTDDRIPARITLDAAKLPQPELNVNTVGLEDFTTVSLTASWELR